MSRAVMPETPLHTRANAVAAGPAKHAVGPLPKRPRLPAPLRWIARACIIAAFAFFIFGPLTNLALWAVAERWYFPHLLPTQWGFSFWARVFRPEGDALASLWSSLLIAVLTVALSLALAVPAGFALGRGQLAWRSLFLLLFLLPQAFPTLAVHMNIARLFYSVHLNGTVAGVVLVHTLQGLVIAVWIAAAAFGAVDAQLEEAARSLGATPWQAFATVTLPLAMPGIMASGIFVFLTSLDEFTGTFFVGAPDVTTLPLLMYRASMAGNYQIASITALILLVPSVIFMLTVERFLRSDVLAKVGV